MQPFTFFISYRREYTAPIALLLKYELEKRLQFVRVSVDVEEMSPGMDFPSRIEQLIEGAHATIVLIGKKWMPRRNEGSVKSPALAKESLQTKESQDWVLSELKHSASAGLPPDGNSRYGLDKRAIIPIFADCDPGFDQFVVPEEIKSIRYRHGQSINSADWPTAIGPLIDRIAVDLKLKKRPEKDEYPKPNAAKARTQPLSDPELMATLHYEDYEGWYLDNFGNAEVRYLVKTFEFPHFNEAADFMELVSKHCRVLNHHPEWRNVFNHVTVALSTWDAQRRVTIYDLHLALFMNKAALAILKAD